MGKKYEYDTLIHDTGKRRRLCDFSVEYPRGVWKRTRQGAGDSVHMVVEEKNYKM